MREIEFRAYDKTAKQMYRVDRLGIGEYSWQQYADGDKQPKTGKNKFYPSQVEIMQYTGLKDKNGTKIFEGDIVKCKLINQVKKNNKWVNEFSWENYEVIYSEKDLGFRFKDEWMSIWKFENCEVEVIGNIYEENKD